MAVHRYINESPVDLNAVSNECIINFKITPLLKRTWKRYNYENIFAWKHYINAFRYYHWENSKCIAISWYFWHDALLFPVSFHPYNYNLCYGICRCTFVILYTCAIVTLEGRDYILMKKSNWRDWAHSSILSTHTGRYAT